jgi:hypothetical protein
VKPKKGCAIINLGDAMVRFTNGALCSGRYVNENCDHDLEVWFGLRTASLSGRAGSTDHEARIRAYLLFGDVVLTCIFALQA